jgi:hypothetical protein
MGVSTVRHPQASSVRGRLAASPVKVAPCMRRGVVGSNLCHGIACAGALVAHHMRWWS